MRIVRLILGAALIGGSAFLGLTLSDRLLAAPDPGPARAAAQGGEAVPVETVAVSTARFTDSLRAVGTARARNAVDVTAMASGRIERIAFRPGDEVGEGDILLELDDRAEAADLAAAEATLAEAEAAFARQEQLNRSGSSSDAAFQTARAARLRAEAERDRDRALLEDRQLRAPFSGVIGLSDLVPGQMLDSGTVVATLDDLEVIEVDFAVPETMLPRLAVGQTVQLRSPAWADRVFTGAITLIDTRVDAATRSIALRAELPNPDRALAGGMFLQVELVLDERERPAIPESALSVEGDVQRVLIARNDEAVWADVQVGQDADGLVEVLDGVEIGTEIIMSNLHRVSAGTKVTTTPRPARTAKAAPAPATMPAPAAGADG